MDSGSVPILCVDINITMDTMLKLDTNVDIDAKCEWTILVGSSETGQKGHWVPLTASKGMQRYMLVLTLS